MSVLIVAEHDGRSLNPSTAKCVRCALEIAGESGGESGGDVELLVASSDGGALATQAASLEGVSRVIRIDHPAHENLLAAALAPHVVGAAGACSHILGPSTTFGKDLMPRVAALLGVPQVSDIMAVEGPRQFRRPIYAGNAIVTVEVPEGAVVVGTVRVASYQAVAGGGNAPIEQLSPQADIPGHTRFISRQSATSDRPDLQTAARVVSGGRALGSAEGFDIIYALADTLGAAVGASRAAVDAGYVPNDMQVGQTGKIIAPELYVAVGISGAIQHVTGIKDAGTIVAINKDADAPIFEVADIGLVADLFTVVPELERLVGSG